MQTKPAIISSIFLASSLTLAMPAHAFDMGNMMNPSKWTGGNNGGNNNMMNPSRWMGGNNNDRYDDYRGGPGYGYGGPGYGYGGAPAYSEPDSESNEAEKKRLKERLRQLESGPR